MAAKGVTAIIGPSGSGKSTLLRVLAGLEQVQAGNIVCQGRTWLDTANEIFVAARQRRVGVVFQDYALFNHLTVRQNIAYGLSGHTGVLQNVLQKLGWRKYPAQVQRRVSGWLQRMQLQSVADAYPEQLSGGQRQRVALARALLTEPELLLLDEPFSALDSRLRTAMRAELQSLIHQINCPVILVTHDLQDVHHLADEVLILHEGRAHGFGKLGEVRSNPGSIVAAQLLGWENILPIVSTKSELHRHKTSQVTGAWGRLQLAESVSPQASAISIRPEHIGFSVADDNTNNLPACLLRVIDTRPVKQLMFALRDNSVVSMYLPWNQPVPLPGTELMLHFPQKHLRQLGHLPLAPPFSVDSDREQDKALCHG